MDKIEESHRKITKFINLGDAWQYVNRQDAYDIAYMNMAIAVSQLSYAIKAQVGCVIVSPSGQVISHGWNGTPSGVSNICEEKDSEGNLKTLPTVIHSEANAILKCAANGVSTKDATLYVTHSPCINCAKMILSAGIKRVVYLYPYKSEGTTFLKEHNIKIQQMFV